MSTPSTHDTVVGRKKAEEEGGEAGTSRAVALARPGVCAPGKEAVADYCQPMAAAWEYGPHWPEFWGLNFFLGDGRNQLAFLYVSN